MMDINFFIRMLHVLFTVHMTIGDDFPLLCPSKPHWNIRAKSVCQKIDDYRCLWDKNNLKFLEQCEGFDIQMKGFRKVIEGDITAGECTENRYQPRMWTTKGNFDCVLEKSSCNEIGQVVYDDGDGVTDRTCGCDYTAGYIFLTQPKNLCYCEPTVEDCTCIEKKCPPKHVVDPEYECRHRDNWKYMFNCKEISRPVYTEVSPEEILPWIEVEVKAIPYKDKALMAVGVVLVLIIVTGIGFLVFYRDREIKNERCRKIQLLEQAQLKERQDKEALERDLQEQKRQNQEIREKQAKEAKETDFQEKERPHPEIIERNIYLKKNKTEIEECIPTPIKVRMRSTVNTKQQESHKKYTVGWKTDNEKFIVTRATEHVADLVNENNIVIVVGSSGSGKSSLIQYIAHNLKTEYGFDIYIVSSPYAIIKYRNENKSQLFVIDDFCGKNYINPSELETWIEYSEQIGNLFTKDQITKHGILRILVGCRSHIFEDEKLKYLELFTKRAVDLHANEHCLLPEEKLKMIQKYVSISEKDWLEIKQNLECFNFFPLFCKLAKGKKVEQLKTISSPIDCMRNDIKDILRTKPMENCALLLCILYPVGFHQDFIDPMKRPKDVQQKVTDIINTYEINLANEKTRAQLLDTFERLDETYVKKKGPMYSISHDRLYDMVSVECFPKVSDLYFKYAPSTLIEELFRFNSVFQIEKEELLIYLEDKEENKFFSRIFQDLSADSFKSFFNNQQLKKQEYRNKVMKYIDQNRKSCDELFRRLDRNGMKEVRKNEYVYYTSPVIEAVKSGFYELVEYLIDIKCDINKNHLTNLVPDRPSPLWYSCERGFVKIVDLLIKHGVEYRDDLVMACYSGMYHGVKMMIDSGVDLSHCDHKNKWTPLIAACRGGHDKIVKMLLEGGADPSQCDTDTSSEKSPLITACERGNIKIVNMLLKSGVDLSQCSTGNGWTPLIVASYEGHGEIVRLLLKGGADPSQRAKGELGWTPLMYACDKGHGHVVKMLLDCEADPLQCNSGAIRRTPLSIASESGHSDIVQMLLEKGADPSVRDYDQRTALDVTKHDTIISILRLHMKQ